MANYNSLKATVNANIKANNNQEITGPVLNNVLIQMIDTLSSGIEINKSSVVHINGDGVGQSLGFSGFDRASFQLNMDFVILPNNTTGYKDIFTISDSNGTAIPIGYYTAGGLNWYVGGMLQKSIQYYKETHINIRFENNSLCVYIDGELVRTFVVSSGLNVIFNRLFPGEPTGEMLVNYLVFFDNEKTHSIADITEMYSATFEDGYIFDELKIMRSELFDQIGSDSVQWVDGTLGDIRSLVFDENSLGVSSYIITYKDYIVTQPTIVYNDDYQIVTKPQIEITKSN